MATKHFISMADRRGKDQHLPLVQCAVDVAGGARQGRTPLQSKDLGASVIAYGPDALRLVTSEALLDGCLDERAP